MNYENEKYSSNDPCSRIIMISKWVVIQIYCTMACKTKHTHNLYMSIWYRDVSYSFQSKPYWYINCVLKCLMHSHIAQFHNHIFVYPTQNANKYFKPIKLQMFKFDRLLMWFIEEQVANTKLILARIAYYNRIW